MAWSYSSISLFKNCPKKYYHLKVAKDIRDDPGDAALYGTEVHEAAEQHIRDGIPVPEKFDYIKPAVEASNSLQGEKHVELKFGVTEDLNPTGFFDKDVWWRGIADFLNINGTKAHLIDWKTGKSARYADTKQLDLLAGAVFIHFPEVEVIRSALAFLVPGDMVQKVHVRERLEDYMKVFDRELDRLRVAEETGIFNANPSGLCRFCPVKECPHNE